MNFEIVQYKSKDKGNLMKLFCEFQDYLISIDKLHRLKRVKGYETKYLNYILNAVKKNSGIIYLVKAGDKVIGYAVGIVYTNYGEERLNVGKKEKIGRLIDLFVKQNYRGQAVGRKLMVVMEKYFKSKKCNLIRIEVYSPNGNAYKFYKKNSYLDESVEVVKFIR